MRNRTRGNNPRDLADALALLPTDVRDAVIVSSRYLTERGIAHALIGGVAVNAHGHAVSTTDVDFLIHDSDFFSGSARSIAIPPGPTAIRGARLEVRIDYLSGHAYPELPDLEREVRTPQSPDEPVPVVGLHALLYMKLSAWRPKDQGHVIGLLQAGVLDVEAFRVWLRGAAGDAGLIEGRLDRLIAQAD